MSHSVNVNVRFASLNYLDNNKNSDNRFQTMICHCKKYYKLFCNAVNHVKMITLCRISESYLEIINTDLWGRNTRLSEHLISQYCTECTQIALNSHLTINENAIISVYSLQHQSNIKYINWDQPTELVMILW